MNLRKTVFAFVFVSVLVALGMRPATSVARADQWQDFPTHGIAAGDVTSHSAVIGSRASGPGRMQVTVDAHGRRKIKKTIEVRAENDFTGKILFEGLRPNTAYRYAVWLGGRNAQEPTEYAAETGSFRTAPVSHRAQSVRFAWGGDLAGQNVCRDANEGCPIFKAINNLHIDLFIGLGDMIYADGVCESIGLYGSSQIAGEFTQSAGLSTYWTHWKYNREDAGYRNLLASTPDIAIWDDHEVVNDFGPLHDTRGTPPYIPGEHLLPLGLQAFLNDNPIAENPLTPKRLYCNIRWGKHLEFFILDTRKYRDANSEADDDVFVKTLLKREPVAWLKARPKASDATWKIIVASVPMSIPTGSAGAAGHDGWVNFLQPGGFERELTDLLRFMRGQDARNVMFITIVVHFAEVFRYTPFAEDLDFQVREYVHGPLNTGLFPNHDFDATFGRESLFFFGPASAGTVTTYEEALPFPSEMSTATLCTKPAIPNRTRISVRSGVGDTSLRGQLRGGSVLADT